MIRSRATSLVLVLGVVAALVLWLAYGTSQGALPACTKTWDGGAGTTAWGTAANWTGDVLPGATDNVCIPDGATVVHSSGTDTISSLASDAGATSGGLTLSGGSLELTYTSAPSTAVSLMQSGATLTGAAELAISKSFVWSAGTEAGTGTTRVLSGGSLEMSGPVTFGGSRTLRNEGTGTWSGGGNISNAASSSPRIENAGSSRSPITAAPSSVAARRRCSTTRRVARSRRPPAPAAAPSTGRSRTTVWWRAASAR